MEESPNWLEMPHELMLNILKRLGDAEILTNASKVCTTWWGICKDPAMWKVINIHKPVDAGDADYDLEALTKRAVNLSSGELIDLSIKGFGNDDLLDYILLRSSKLNSLCLADFHNITISGLNRALKMVPQLEKLHIANAPRPYKEVMVLSCPQLNSFRLDYKAIYLGITNDPDAIAIAKNMPELRHLKVSRTILTCIGLKAILDGCPHLESLDVRSCFYNIYSNGNAVIKLCRERIKNFKGPFDLMLAMLQCVSIPDPDDDFDAFSFDYM